MINMQDFIGNGQEFRKFEVDELLFAEFQCPMDDSLTPLWWHDNFFAYVLTGETFIKTTEGEYTLTPDSCVFARKGSALSRSRVDEDFCEILIFIPDDFIRTVVQKYHISLNPVTPNLQTDTIIPLKEDKVISSYFYSLLSYFHQKEAPSPTLLKLKFEELLINIISNRRHSTLKDYFGTVCSSTKPSVREIMEANFYQNLSLTEFARICARSLTSFKVEFKSVFQTSPGKWLTEKRLEYSHYLLETTDQSLDEISDLSGFKNKSHFIKIFKEKYGQSPGQFRLHQKEMSHLSKP